MLFPPLPPAIITGEIFVHSVTQNSGENGQSESPWQYVETGRDSVVRFFVSCGRWLDGTNEETPEEPAVHDLNNPAIKTRAERIISTFENSTTDIQYDYAENIRDGRGITAGRAGFTSGTHDLLLVVETYSRLLGDEANTLTAYLPALRAVDGTASLEGLDGFETVWRDTVRADDRLRQAQDTVYDDLYFVPAMAAAQQAGIVTALGQLIILDTGIQHGTYDDPDGLQTIIAETTAAAGLAADQESQWLARFLEIRRQHLLNPANPATAEGWRNSVSRVDALNSLLQSGNMALDLPLNWSVYGDEFTL